MRKQQPANIILVEDDDNIRELVAINLKHSGFNVEAFFSIEQMKKNTDQLEDSDLLILDIMLPGKSGLAFAAEVKEQSIMIPILFISALGQQEKIKQAYDSGAIDYIIKPFDIETLLAKISNLLHYFTRREEETLPGKIGICHIDWQLMQVQGENETTRLSAKEGQVLAYFLKNPGKIISRKELIEKIWGSDVYVSDRTIDNFILKLRKIFEKNPATPSFFITYPKQGYAFVGEDP